MIKTINMLYEEFKDYKNFYNKIELEEKKGNLIKIKRGLYETNINREPFALANIIVSPSYISFETALAYYNLIPEAVCIVKSATFKKNKKKEIRNRFSLYTYQDINPNAYPYGIDVIEIDGENVKIASKEKALLDTISIISPRNNLKEIEDLLFEDLRINENIFDTLDMKSLMEMCDLYCSKSLKLLKKYIGERYDK